MSTPLYMKETTKDKVNNSKISAGCALLFYLDGKLQMKLPNGTYKDVGGSGSGNIDVTHFVISRPISDESLYPKIMASQTGDFLSKLEIDPLNNESDKTYFEIFDGNEWIAFPNDGLGTPFDRMEVSVDISKFSSLTQPYYIKYCWGLPMEQKVIYVHLYFRQYPLPIAIKPARQVAMLFFPRLNQQNFMMD